MNIILGKVLSIFLIIGVGFFANKVNILPSESNKYLVDLLILITTPCMILTSIISQEMSTEIVGTSIRLMLCAAIYLLIASIMAYFIFTKIIKVKPKRDIAIYAMIFTSVNCGFMGFPITFALFGNDILFLMVLFNIVHTIYLYPFCGIQLNLVDDSQKSFNWKSILSAFSNPCSIASLLGLIMLFSGIGLPSVLFDTMEMIGDATVPLSMILVGIQLGNSNFGRILKNKTLIFTACFRMFITPVLMFLAVNWLPLSSNIKIAMIFAACLPNAVGIVPIISMEKRNALLSAEGVAFTTLLSLIVIPVAAMWIISYYGL